MCLNATRISLFLAALFGGVMRLFALTATNYVAVSGSDAAGDGTVGNPYASIQRAVDATVVGGTVFVAPGTYASGAYTSLPASGYSRVVITNEITVKSLEGAAKTIIEGAYPGSGTNAVRCVYMSAGRLDGFTLKNGATDQAVVVDWDSPVINGGGLCSPRNIRSATAYNCVITGCLAFSGGGAYWTTLVNCTVVGNNPLTTRGDGVWSSWVRNSIVYDNGDQNHGALLGAGFADASIFEYTCTTPLPASAVQCVSNAPLFATGTYQLSPLSPCVDAGLNALALSGEDGARAPRIDGKSVDLGAYEVQIGNAVESLLNLPQVSGYSNITVTAGATATTYAVTLGPVSNNGIAYLETVWTNSGTITFSWEVSSEEEYDWLSFSVDNTTVAQISGENRAVVTQQVVGAGAHVLRWTYQKDGSDQSGDDCGSIANIVWVPATLQAELSPSSPNLGFTGDVGAVRPFPYGFDACFIDPLAPTGATGGSAVKLGGLSGDGTPFVADGKAISVYALIQGVGTLTFKWYASCESLDVMQCRVDGVEVKRISGNSAKNGGWVLNTIELATQGVHRVEWTYTKNSSGFSGQDCVWIDNVSWSLATKQLTVINGVGSGTYLVNSWVSIAANSAASSNEIFKCWAGDVETIANTNSAATTIQIPMRNCVVYAVYQNTYQLTVTSGTGSGIYSAGTSVAIVASAAPAGYMFDQWSGDTESVADVNAATTTVVMAQRSINLIALYKMAEYDFTVVGGREWGAVNVGVAESYGEPLGRYPEGAEIILSAGNSSVWKIFERWTSQDGVVFSNPTNALTTCFMPAKSASVEAIFREMTEKEKLESALTIPGQALNITASSPVGIVAESTGGVRFNDAVVKFGGAEVKANQSVSLSFDSFKGDGVLLFWWKANAEVRYDNLRLAVNGTPITQVSGKNGSWSLCTNYVYGATTLSMTFSRDSSYNVGDNAIYIDRVTWIPAEMVSSLGLNDLEHPLANVNKEGSGFEGSDGGVFWTSNTPDNTYAVQFGRFSYLTNNARAQLQFARKGTGVYHWQWASDSEARCDELEYFVNNESCENHVVSSTNNFGNTSLVVSGKEKQWWTEYYVITNLATIDRKANLEKPYEVTFKYSKDYSVSVNQDCTWLKNLVYTPTRLISLENASITTFTLPPALQGIYELSKEAEKSIYPVGTTIHLLADPPSDTNLVFDSWVGNATAYLSSTVSAAPTLTVPNFEVQLSATYRPASTSGASSAPVGQSVRFVNVNVAQNISSPVISMNAAFARSVPTATVELFFECPPGQDYTVLFSTDLSAPEGNWVTLPVTERAVLGDTADGSRSVKVTTEVQATAPQGFFKLRLKE